MRIQPINGKESEHRAAAWSAMRPAATYRSNIAHYFGARRVEKVQKKGFEKDRCLFMVREGKDRGQMMAPEDQAGWLSSRVAAASSSPTSCSWYIW